MKNAQCLRILFLMALLMIVMRTDKIEAFSTIAKNDPYPLFSTTYPYNYLLDNTKNYLKGFDCCYCREHISIAFTGFYQKADRGSNYDREKNLPLGDLEGRWAMLSMLYGDPTPGPGVTPEEFGAQLLFAKEELFPDVAPLDPIPEEEIIVDAAQKLGFFSAPIKYRKHGVRLEVAAQPHEDIGILFQGGWADIKQTLTNPVNLTALPDPNCTPVTDIFVGHVNCLLMSTSARNAVFKQQEMDLNSTSQNVCDFRKSSFEDLRFSIWLRHIFQANCSRECEWPPFLFIPFIFFEASVCPSRAQEHDKLLTVPFGNDRHSSVGFTAGFHIDFRETVEIGFHGGIMHFTARNVGKYRLPTHPTQSGIFPFATEVRVQPGNNHHFAVSMHAYRFLGKLSCWVEFEYVNHAEDRITILDEAVRARTDLFLVGQKECLTKFTAQFLTTVMNYEISPNFTLGFGVQWPLQQRNAYRSTTVLGTIKATF